MIWYVQKTDFKSSLDQESSSFQPGVFVFIDFTVQFLTKKKPYV